jgi:hypothetical protein
LIAYLRLRRGKPFVESIRVLRTYTSPNKTLSGVPKRVPLERRVPTENWRFSSLAVASAVCGVASVFGLLVPEIAAISLIGVATGAVALRSTRKYELCGRGTAVFGMAVSLFFMIATPAWHAAWFNSESPKGYARVDFSSLTKENPRGFESLVGENICLKGYAYPVPSPVAEFVFSSNGVSKTFNNMIIVQLPTGETWRWQSEALAVSGTLIVNPAAAADPVQPRFKLTNSKIRRSCTRFQLANLVSNRGC